MEWWHAVWYLQQTELTKTCTKLTMKWHMVLEGISLPSQMALKHGVFQPTWQTCLVKPCETTVTNGIGFTEWRRTTLPIIPSSHILQPYCWWTNFWEVWTMNYGTKYLPTYLCAGFCPCVISGNYKHITQVPNLRNSVWSCWQGYTYATFRDDGTKDANATST